MDERLKLFKEIVEWLDEDNLDSESKCRKCGKEWVTITGDVPGDYDTINPETGEIASVVWLVPHPKEPEGGSFGSGQMAVCTCGHPVEFRVNHIVPNEYGHHDVDGVFTVGTAKYYWAWMEDSDAKAKEFTKARKERVAQIKEMVAGNNYLFNKKFSK